MNRALNFPPIEILNPGDRQRLHDSVLVILERTGVHIDHEEGREVALNAGGKLIHGSRISFNEAVLMDALDKAPASVTLTGLDENKVVHIGGSEVNFMSGAGILDVLDLEGNFRASTLDDLEEFTRLCDALEYLDVNHGILDPRDAQGPALYPLAASRIIPNSSKPTALVIDTARDVEAIARMAEVALGSAKAVRERPFFTIHDSNTRPPLFHDRKNFDVLQAACRYGFPTGLTTWPMPGVSSPVTLSGTLAMKYAEFFTGLILAQTMNPGNPFLFPVEIGGSEMKKGNVVTVSPDIALAGIIGAQMARYYHLPSVAVTATDAKIPDAQAGAEKAFLLTSQALAGINLIHGCTSEMDGMMIASLEQCVIDNDIMGLVRRMVTGVEISEETLALDVIDEISRGGGNFLGHPHTRKHFRQVIYEPGVFTQERRVEWQAAGSKSARQAANEKARKILEMEKPALLSADKVAEIQKIADEYCLPQASHPLEVKT